MSGLLRAPLTAHHRQIGPERSRWPATSGTAVPCGEGLAQTPCSGIDGECSAGWHARVCAPVSCVSANAETPGDLQLGCRAVQGLSCSPETTRTSSASSTSQKTANAPHDTSFVTDTAVRQDYRNAELLQVCRWLLRCRMVRPRKSSLSHLACILGSACGAFAAYHGALSALRGCASVLPPTGHNSQRLLHQTGGPGGPCGLTGAPTSS